MNKTLREVAVVCISGTILGLGCVFFVQAGFGSDALTTMMSGLNRSLSIGLSTANILINVIFFATAYILSKKHIGIGSFAFLFSSTVSINMGMKLIPQFINYQRYIGFVFGVLFLSISIAIASKVDCGKNPYDALCFSLIDKANLKYNVIRVIIDAILLIVGIILGGTFGIGTIINVFAIGNITYQFMKLFDKWTWLNNFLQKNTA